MTTAITYIIGGVLSAGLLGFGVGMVFRVGARIIDGLTTSPFKE